MNKTSRYSMVLAAVAMGGCSGLNVQWAGTASYNTPQVRTEAILNPGAEKPQAAASAPVAAASAVK